MRPTFFYTKRIKLPCFGKSVKLYLAAYSTLNVKYVRDPDYPFYRVYHTENQNTAMNSSIDLSKKVASFWHSVPLLKKNTTHNSLQRKPSTESTLKFLTNDNYEENAFNMVVEIPKNSKRKYEMSKTLPYNPLVQDRFMDGTLRYFRNGPIPWNYGFLPQTWVSPCLKIKNFFGDNDPLDVLELGSTPLSRGAIVPIHILGALALIDENCLDIKIIALRENKFKSLCKKQHDDLMKQHLNKLRFWFQTYKLYDFKPLNTFLYEGRCLSKQYVFTIIQKSFEQWQNLHKLFDSENSALC
ncbi:inorganic pyrophosphatase 2, mitochondrial-like isoform X1 [Hylaeus volcanicus]|uniref:inorganic pyrophosphatase 2, mitochondrial-like isoform X1 n=1 Tax=Hylaeus volcanicus TaxID=313075 RepID=UPI0023B80A88|nr:inorganic pyrophosphatase 2, mitochondrial-like isoform X1 [Hylaeus volcanicus]XP_053993622.1 inorganic pyrophosphatase 2, mitochondrial-like isoform X1 [Hylaeus volcanicus]